jgi:hypothetical protein
MLKLGCSIKREWGSSQTGIGAEASARALGARGRGFESHIPDQKTRAVA